MRAVILAGGKGTRIAGAFPGIPKPLIEVSGRPVLLRAIEMLCREGINEITVAAGYMADKIRDFLSANPVENADITVFEESVPLGTGGALRLIDGSDDFLVLSGDLVFDISLDRMIAFHKKHAALATVFAHPNSHPADSTAVVADSDGRVTAFVPAEMKNGVYENLSNAGIQIISPALLKNLPGGEADLDRDIIIPAVGTGRVYAYRCSEYVHDMGTPERLAAVESDIARDIPAGRNLRKKQKAVFLDRDGTINVYKGYITSPGEIELIDGAAEAVRAINRKGLLAILITNQAVIARGECTFEQLREINSTLEAKLGAKGAYLDGIYFCPHHPDGGFPGERAEFKIKCSCRKPAPGMIFRAADDFNLDLAQCVMAGDALCDMKTALNAGCAYALLGCGKQEEGKEKFVNFPDLRAFAATL